jgi:hypothetical protein
LFDNFFEDDFFPRRERNLMKTDIIEKKHEYVIDIDLPGFEKDNISLSLNNGYLEISAKTIKEEDNNDEKLVHKERFYGECSRSFYVGDNIEESDIDAEFKSNRGNNINNMFINPYSTATTSSSISRDALFNNKQENKINEKIKQIIFLISDYNNYMIKFLHLLNKEIKENKRNYMKLLKTNYDYELKINSQTKKLDDIKNDFEKYNISKKIRGEKVKENTIKNIKSQFLKKENEYLMHNFQLKDEIYSLVKLLDKNKGYFNKYKEAKKEINDNKKMLIY